MKTTDKILVYDDHCPLCVAYTKAFVRTGILSKEGRKSFSEVGDEWLSKIDFARSRNEIPLIDTKTLKVQYGIDALLEVLNKKLPGIKTIGNLTPIKWFLVRLYRFISYNRKVIVAVKTRINCVDCTPEFNLFYRVVFMAFFLLFNTSMLVPVHHYLLAKLPFYGLNEVQLQLTHFALVSMNVALAFTLGKKGGIEYLGQVNMLALITILLLIPLTIINSFFLVPVTMNGLLLAAITAIVLREYFRRMDFAGILNGHPWIMIVNFISLALFLSTMFLLNWAKQ